MLRSVKDLIGKPIQGSDDNVGKVSDFLFDDQKWGIRYMVADTGGWLSSRKVLISPRNLETPETGAYTRHFPVNLTKDQIEKSPPIEEHAPVSQLFEEEYAKYYEHPPYWSGASLWGAEVYPVSRPGREVTRIEVEEHNKAVADIRKRHLRSADEVIDYHVSATDGEIGHVEDLILDTDVWRLRYFIVDTRNWIPGKKVLIDIDWLTGIEWSGSVVNVALAQDQIKDSPEFDPHSPVNRSYEQQLYDFYGQPYYW